MMDRPMEVTSDLGPEPWLRLAPKQAMGGKTETPMAYAALRSREPVPLTFYCFTAGPPDAPINRRWFQGLATSSRPYYRTLYE
jgi:hypothetical protein